MQKPGDSLCNPQIDLQLWKSRSPQICFCQQRYSLMTTYHHLSLFLIDLQSSEWCCYAMLCRFEAKVSGGLTGSWPGKEAGQDSSVQVKLPVYSVNSARYSARTYSDLKVIKQNKEKNIFWNIKGCQQPLAGGVQFLYKKISNHQSFRPFYAQPSLICIQILWSKVWTGRIIAVKF